MTDKQVTLTGIENKWIYSEKEGDYPKITAPDGCFYCFSFSIDAQQLCENLNEMQDKINQLNDENWQLKQQIKDLYKFVKYDVDNEIDVYPKSILEYLVNILKIIGDVE